MQELLQMKNCLLCGSGIEKRYHTERMVIPYQCPVCGRVTLAEDAAMALHYGSIESKHLLSGFTRERTELGLNPIDITARDIEEIGKSTNVPRNVSEKLDRLMQYLERKSEYPGKYVGLVSQRDYPIAYARNFEEL